MNIFSKISKGKPRHLQSTPRTLSDTYKKGSIDMSPGQSNASFWLKLKLIKINLKLSVKVYIILTSSLSCIYWIYELYSRNTDLFNYNSIICFDLRLENHIFKTCLWTERQFKSHITCITSWFSHAILRIRT